MRALWLVDGSYMHSSMKSYCRRLQRPFVGVDYLRLKRKIMEAYAIDGMDSYYFDSVDLSAPSHLAKFHAWLRLAEPVGPGMRVKLYPFKTRTVRCEHCGKFMTTKVQKGVDVGITTIALRHYRKYDAIVLCGGDGDFADYLRFLVEDIDMKFFLVGFGGTMSTDIQQYCTSIYMIDDHYDEVSIDRSGRQERENEDELYEVDDFDINEAIELPVDFNESFDI